MSEPVVHEIYGVKFGQNLSGVRGRFFLGTDADPHDEHMRLDYYVWVIRSDVGVIVLDAGFTDETNRTRQRDHWENPTAALARLSVDPAEVSTVILSHLHYDHCGDLEPFRNAQFVLQESEMAFWVGRYASRGEFAHLVEVSDLQRIVALNAAGRVRWADGALEVADGVWVQKVGGHTPGMQATLVRTLNGVVVLASDASHFFENIESDKPFAVNSSVIDVYRSFDMMREAATSGIVVAGHDPEIMRRFPAVPGQEGHVVRIA